jgi:hypothetical protein
VRFVRVFAISIATLLLFLVSTAPGYASTKPHPPHGCAQPVPPLMSGSPGPPPATPGIVLINEILNNPASTWNCSELAGTSSISTDAWVELYNPQNQPFNLYEARASLDSGSLDKAYHFPFGASIASHGYLVIFPEAYSLSNTSIAGNTIRLIFGGVTIIDLVSLPTLAPDTSYARIPDGSANWQITTNPTIDASNLSSTQVASTPISTKSSGHSGNTSTGSSNGNTTPTLVTGKQPGWTKLQLPAANSVATSTSNSPIVTTPATSTTSSAWNTQRRILLTILIVALALSLFWCWKLFSSS